ncbi:MAG TPA: phosphoribosylaminoimidazolesuccinocarboxamide synthase [archaeon]|nr:phosphoribosylaminoimidazolesuccinocarboxamide synthase [archaeon]
MTTLLSLPYDKVPSLPTVRETNLMPGVRRGKTRDIYDLGETLALVATDRISAYDSILSPEIPEKGPMLTGCTAYAFRQLENYPTHFISQPHPRIIIVKKCEPYLVEFIMRNGLTGSAWRQYKNGKRDFLGYVLADGIRENELLQEPIFTPTTKARNGHDMTIETAYEFERLMGGRPNAVAAYELCSEAFKDCSGIIESHGGVLADGKMEIGVDNGGNLTLIDEVLTPDSVRMMGERDYHELLESNAPPEYWYPFWRDKQFLRERLRSETDWEGNGPPPELSDELIAGTARAYALGYRLITGEDFVIPRNAASWESMIEALAKTGYI